MQAQRSCTSGTGQGRVLAFVSHSTAATGHRRMTDRRGPHPHHGETEARDGGGQPGWRQVHRQVGLKAEQCSHWKGTSQGRGVPSPRAQSGHHSPAPAWVGAGRALLGTNPKTMRSGPGWSPGSRHPLYQDEKLGPHVRLEGGSPGGEKEQEETGRSLKGPRTQAAPGVGWAEPTCVHTGTWQSCMRLWEGLPLDGHRPTAPVRGQGRPRAADAD